MLTDSQVRRYDVRTEDEFITNVERGNEHEELIVSEWCKSHNNYVDKLNKHFATKMSFKMIGPRKGLIEQLSEDRGDALLMFDGLHKFSVVVEMKPVVGHKDYFRPQVSDVNLCIKTKRPYVVCMHFGTKHPALVLLTVDHLKEIRGSCDPIVSDAIAGEVYGGKSYYLIDACGYPEFPRVKLSSLEPIMTYRQMLDYLYECKEKV